MADNTQVSAAVGSGDTLRTDDNAGIKTPVSKIELGVDGSFDGFVAVTNPMPVAPSDGTRKVTTLFDADTGAGTQYLQGMVLRKSASGGSVELGTGTDPVRTDPTGTTAQPITDNGGNISIDDGGNSITVDGTVTVNAGTNLNTSALALESGGNLATVASVVRAEDSASADADKGIAVFAVRKAAPANTSGTDGDYEALQISAGRLWASATIDAALPAGTNAIGKLAANDGVDVGDVTVNNASGAAAVNIQDGGNSITVDGTVTANAGTGNFAANIAQVAGSAVATAATGVQKVGIVGNAGATVDGAVGAGTAPANQVVVGSIYSTAAPAPTNGQSMAQQADQAGNLRTAPGIAAAALSAWNSGTSLNATQTIFSNSGVPAVLLHLVQTSTLTAGAVTVEVSYDNSNWVTIPADQVIDPASTTQATVALPYTVQASTNKPLLLLTKGAQGLRIKLSTQITGTGSVTPNYALLPYAAIRQTTLGSGSATIGSLAANQSVNLAQLAGTATDTNSGNKSAGTLRVVLATDQPQLTNKLLVTPDANSAINNAQIAGTTTATGNGTASAGCQRVTIASDNTAFTVNAAQSGTFTVQPGNTANTTPWLVSQTPATSGGCSISRTLSAANTTGINAKGSAGQVYGWAITNTNASARFVKLYNKATAPTVGTDTPVMTLCIPGNASGAGQLAAEFTSGIAFSAGIGYGITTGVADNDTGAPAANEVIVNLLYK